LGGSRFILPFCQLQAEYTCWLAYLEYRYIIHLLAGLLETVKRSAFVCTRVAGIDVVIVLELVGELRCHIPRNRSSPESMRSVAPGLEGFRRPVKILGRVSNSEH